MRVRFLISLLALIAALVVPSAALGVGSSGSGSGGNSGSGLTGGGSGGGTPTNVKWYELENTDTKDFKFGALSRVLKETKSRQSSSDLGAYAVSKKISGVFQDACDRGSGQCLLWKDDQRTGGTWGYEVHTPYAEKNTPFVAAEVTVGFNIKVWRENPDREGFDLIFERRVGLGNGDSDPQKGPFGQDIHRKWWYGSNTADFNGEMRNLGGGRAESYGGSYSNSKSASAGMIGSPRPADVRNCQRNYNSGGNGERKVQDSKGRTVTVESEVRPKKMPKDDTWCYWEGDQLGGNSFRWGADSGTRELEEQYRGGRSGLPKDQFGSESDGTLGAGGKGLKEALFVDWRLPLDNNGKNTISYQLEGAPGLYYIVQIVALDAREKIQPLKGASAYFDSNQMLKAYIANPSFTPDEDDRYVCSTDPAACSAPEMEINLEATTPAQTREETTQTISAEPLDRIGDLQAVFPMESNLIHFSPQMEYSSARATGAPSKTYAGDYISYGSERAGSLIERRPSPYQPDPALTGGKSAQLMEAYIKRAAYLDPTSTGAVTTTDPLSEGEPLTYEMTWLKPTLSNPCDAPNLPESRTDPRAWPQNPERCPENARGYPSRFDAWDDMLQARLTWNSVWVSDILDKEKDPTATYGQITNQPLRCAETGAVSQLYPRNECDTPRFGLLDAAIGQNTQHAQGYLLAASEPERPSVPVRFRLNTNRPERVSAAYLYERGAELVDSRSRSIDSTRAPLQTNTVTGDVELNYCRQGLPEGASLFTPGSADRDVKDSETADEECRGAALRWKWDKETCRTGSVPATGAFPKPTLASVLNSARGGEELPAGGSYDQPLKAGQTRAYDPDDFNGMPYDGSRPSPQSSPECQVSPPKHYTEGKWDRDFRFKELGVSGANCVFSANQVNRFNTVGDGRPNGQAPRGTATLCPNRFDVRGSNRYAFGFWYPTNAKWEWDAGSCVRDNTDDLQALRERTELWRQRDAGKFYNAAPAQSGGLGRNANNLVTYAGNQTKGAGQFFSDSQWECGRVVTGHLKEGRWVLSRQAGPGWGSNNTSGRINLGDAAGSGVGLIADFEFNVPDPELAYRPVSSSCPAYRSYTCPGTWWSMKGSYKGFTNYKWLTRLETRGAVEDDGSSAYIKVYGPRNSR